IVAGISLYFRRVPPKSLYGVRGRATRDEGIWYEINARAGRDLILLGAVYLGLLGFSVRFCQSCVSPFQVLGALVVVSVGMIADTIILTSAAARLAGEHR